MKKKQHIFKLSLLFALFSTKIFAQSAAFTFNPQNGCTPASVQFTDLSIGATSWSWQFGNGDTSSLRNPVEVYNTKGTYIITLTINAGASSATDTIVVNTMPLAPVSIIGNPNPCFGSNQSYSTTSLGATSYNWTYFGGSIIGSSNNSAVTINISSGQSGLCVTGTNVCGTTPVTCLTINAVGGIDTLVTLNGNTLVSHASGGGLTYFWFTCSGSQILGANQYTYTPTVSGSYYVTIYQSPFACSGTSNCHNVIITSSMVSEKNDFGLTIFPNPTTNNFKIKNSSLNQKIIIEIMNVYGEVVYAENLFVINEYLIDMKFAKGIYFVRMYDDKRSSIQKLIVD